MGNHHNDNHEDEQFTWLEYAINKSEELIDQGLSVRDALIFCWLSGHDVGHDLARIQYESDPSLTKNQAWISGVDKGYTLAKQHLLTGIKRGNSRANHTL